MKNIVIIPTYNEIDNINDCIDAVMMLSEPFDILIVDDNSPDGTAALVRQKISQYPNRIFLEERTEKSGLGTAYIHGFKWALAKGYDYIFEMDADFSHNPKDLPRLLVKAKEGYDCVVGSRYTKGGNVKNWPWQRIFISYGASVYTRLITFMPVKDCTAGFICYTDRALRTIDLDAVHFIGYAFQIEMKYRIWRKKMKIAEVPITFIDRAKGVSKMSKGIIKEAVFGVWRMKFFV